MPFFKMKGYDVMETITLKKKNTIKFEIKREDGTSTGEYLEFDLESVDFPLRLNDSDRKHKQNIDYVKMQLAVIDKEEDVKGKYVLSRKEEKKFELMQEFYKREKEALDLIIGKGGTKKLLDGRSPYVTMYDDIYEMLEPIFPKIQTNADDIAEKIKAKYSDKEKDIL